MENHTIPERMGLNLKNYLREKKQLSEITLDSYENDINQYSKYLQSRGIYALIRTTQPITREYLDYLQEQGKSKATIARHVVSLKALYSFAVVDGTFGENLMFGVKALINKRKKPKILSVFEIDLIINQPDTTHAKGLRDRAILELLYTSGIKMSEMVNLNMEDINLKKGTIVCISARKKRVTCLTKETLSVFDTYIKYGRNKLINNPKDNAVFINYAGYRVTRQGIWKEFKVYVTQAKIKKKVTPSMLRDSMAAHLVQNGANIDLVGEFLGHKHKESTKVFKKFIPSQTVNSDT